jgi:16S rRNA (guanine(1405)-N(7))-methyltransferase
LKHEVVERVRRSSRYRDVDPALVTRLADEELRHAGTADEAVKRVKRRLHQAVGAFRGAPVPARLAAAWTGDLTSVDFRAACAEAMRTHASTRERVAQLESFYAGIWADTGPPHRVLDLGCGLHPLGLPWMGIGDATYLAVDVDDRALATVRGFLELVDQPHRVEARDLVSDPPMDAADVALLLKLVPTLDRQDSDAAGRLLRGLRVGAAVVSFPARSLGGRTKGMERTYRERMDRLLAESGRVTDVREASVPNELVFVLALSPPGG